LPLGRDARLPGEAGAAAGGEPARGAGVGEGRRARRVLPLPAPAHPGDPVEGAGQRRGVLARQGGGPLAGPAPPGGGRRRRRRTQAARGSRVVHAPAAGQGMRRLALSALALSACAHPPPPVAPPPPPAAAARPALPPAFRLPDEV